ncbi:hypothetical protein CWB96_16000 [Pseudoalteromonas citrea]|uniref:Uncharacterized protein n=1 Tax=Pseudoalteromonas citrea TaxID=43655 RepID=A0A5S3XN91_9GAMM|nr:hypothetical protein [Pseudoalteromonas citrea]TMP38502.1 hypothetical protein CWB97_21875 [Pseudoalteromonas citrea]TMP56010.1 hypothetical protein CWB96_16000 [Pseudoalteromonas citrea]
MNKLIITGICVFTCLLSVKVVSASDKVLDKIETQEGYPYKNLIMKAGKVELLYITKSEHTTCRVNVSYANEQYQGSRFTVSNTKFEKSPMAACLTRPIAKKLLSKL